MNNVQLHSAHHQCEGTLSISVKVSFSTLFDFTSEAHRLFVRIFVHLATVESPCSLHHIIISCVIYARQKGGLLPEWLYCINIVLIVLSIGYLMASYIAKNYCYMYWLSLVWHTPLFGKSHQLERDLYLNIHCVYEIRLHYSNSIFWCKYLQLR